MKYIGIDPGGSSGCIAAYDPFNKTVETLKFAKATNKDISDFVLGYNIVSDLEYYIASAVIEKVHSMPKQGVASSFKFGENYGLLQGLMWAHRVPFRLETPTTWMKHFGMKKAKNESDTAWKKRLKQRAEMIFPDRKITKDEADAILIAVYNYETTK